jgi:hypothetical protein
MNSLASSGRVRGARAREIEYPGRAGTIWNDMACLRGAKRRRSGSVLTISNASDGRLQVWVTTKHDWLNSEASSTSLETSMVVWYSIGIVLIHYGKTQPNCVSYCSYTGTLR